MLMLKVYFLRWKWRIERHRKAKRDAEKAHRTFARISRALEPIDQAYFARMKAVRAGWSSEKEDDIIKWHKEATQAAIRSPNAYDAV